MAVQVGGQRVTFALGADGLPKGAPSTVTRASLRLPGRAHELDEFGASLASTGSMLLVGAPMREVGKVRNAGEVAALTWDGRQLRGTVLTENSPGVPGHVGKDHDFGRDVALGDGYAAVGVPGASVGDRALAGRVQPFRIEGSRLVALGSIDQNTRGVLGKALGGHIFGRSVAVVRPCPGVAGLLVGSSDRRVNGFAAGAALAFPFRPTSTCPAREYRAGDPLTPMDDEVAVGCVVAPFRHGDPALADGYFIGSCGDGDGAIGHLHVFEQPTSADRPLDAIFQTPALSRPGG